MSNKVVPFGKYKGQPVEVMMADQPYVQWLMAQDWFREKPLYQIVINYGAEPQETPEHNAMQVLFLDDALCVRLMRRLNPQYGTEAEWRIHRRAFEDGRPAVDVALHAATRDSKGYDGWCYWDVKIELKPVVGDDYPVILRQMNTNGARTLVTKDYTGQGATRDQFIALFKTAGITVVFLDEIG